jgi:hypothetical protein
MRYAVAVILAGALVVALAAAGAHAETPTPTPTRSATATAGVTPDSTPVQMQLRVAPNTPELNWDAVAGAESYHVVGTAAASEVNAVDICMPAAAPQSKKIDIDVELAGTARRYVIALPLPSAGDVWFIANVRASIDARTDDGITIATGGTGFTADAFCDGPVVLPSTGTGPRAYQALVRASSMLIVAASAIVLAGGGLALRRTRRR